MQLAAPAPESANTPENALRGYARGGVKIIELGADDRGHAWVLVDETLPKAAAPYDELPFALTPGSPVPFGTITNAIEELSRTVDSRRTLHPHPALDLLRRLPPRLRGGARLPTGGQPLHDILAAVRLLDHSDVPVQGPPGTGMTYVGSHVVRALVNEGWRIGVVAQSHAVVEHMRDAVVEAGVPGVRVAKKATGNETGQAWTVIGDKQHAEFLAAHADGCVIGGTAWDFVNTDRVEREQLDLLVIDEAGQFSLAHDRGLRRHDEAPAPRGSTAATPGQPGHPPGAGQRVRARLGDGRCRDDAGGPGLLLEPDPPDAPGPVRPGLAALLPGRALLGGVGDHCPPAGGRCPGVRVRWVDHVGCSIESEQEADTVVTQVRELLGTPWGNPSKFKGTRPLFDQDFIVVAPYNAQVNAIRHALDAAGLGGVRVGTVDRFQGREAAVVIVSMTASAVSEIPRGVGCRRPPRGCSSSAPLSGSAKQKA